MCAEPDTWSRVLAAGGDPEAMRGVNAAELAEAVPGLRNWLWARGLIQHLDAANAWCYEMGAADFAEVAENVASLDAYLGDGLNQEERDRLLRGTR